MIPGTILLIIILSFVLIKAADLVVVSIRGLARGRGANVYALSVVLLAVSTSFPELFVSITSAVEGSSKISLGVVLGSNIANISLVLGIAALIAGKVEVSKDFLKRDVSIALVAGLLPVILIIDGTLGRVDGLILLAIYMAYTTSFFKGRFFEIGEKLFDEEYVYRFLTRRRSIDAARTKEVGRFFVGIALLLLVSDAIVKLSVSLAGAAGLSVFVIGLIILAAGTSLPELAFSLRSLNNHQPKMLFGNLLGSVIANSTLVVGAAAVIRPITVETRNGYLTASIAFVVTFLLFWYFIRSKYRLERWESLGLIVVYSIFLLTELLA